MIKGNKPDIFLRIVNDHKGIIYKIARAYCKDSEDRNDLIQEVMMH